MKQLVLLGMCVLLAAPADAGVVTKLRRGFKRTLCWCALCGGMAMQGAARGAQNLNYAYNNPNGPYYNVGQPQGYAVNVNGNIQQATVTRMY
jgi:hypothetical protein